MGKRTDLRDAVQKWLDEGDHGTEMIRLVAHATYDDRVMVMAYPRSIVCDACASKSRLARIRDDVLARLCPGCMQLLVSCYDERQEVLAAVTPDLKRAFTVTDAEATYLIVA
jgi:hypothetical protein